MPPLPFSPVKFSPLIERLFADDSRERFPRCIPSPLNSAIAPPASRLRLAGGWRLSCFDHDFDFDSDLAPNAVITASIVAAIRTPTATCRIARGPQRAARLPAAARPASSPPAS